MRSSINSHTTSCVAAVKKGTAGEGVFSHCLKSTKSSFLQSLMSQEQTPPPSQCLSGTYWCYSIDAFAYLGFVCCASSINVTQQELSIVSFRQPRLSSLCPNAAKEEGWVGQGSCKIQRNMEKWVSQEGRWHKDNRRG